MNDMYSNLDIYYERWLTASLQEACRDRQIVVLTGARQVGKSTLLAHAEPFRHWRSHTMDDFDALDQATRAPEALWAGTDRVVLDEVQKAPKLLQAVKIAVDRNPGTYRFVLSGSANLLLMKQVSESLAGRAVYFILDPMTLGEIRRAPQPDILARLLNGDLPDEGTLPEEPADPAEIILRGLMPPLLHLALPQSWVRWWEGYVATYLERDLRQIAQIDALVDFHRLMELLALRSGQLLNQSALARDAHMSQPTVHRYLGLLEATHLFERLPAYAVTHTTRLLKSPKIFLNDPGLAVFLSGYYTVDDVRAAREYGAYFETLIYHHLRVLTRLMTPAGRLFFWRTRSGAEVDFVVEHGRKVIAIEVKSASNPGYGEAAGLRAFLDDHPNAAAGVLLHSGRAIRRLGEKIVALPWTMLV